MPKTIKKFQKIKTKDRENTLTKKEIKRLIVLGENIQTGLSCDLNETGFPCRTDRLYSVKLMKEYLSIHDYEIKDIL